MPVVGFVLPLLMLVACGGPAAPGGDGAGEDSGAPSGCTPEADVVLGVTEAAPTVLSGAVTPDCAREAFVALRLPDDGGREIAVPADGRVLVPGLLPDHDGEAELLDLQGDVVARIPYRTGPLPEWAPGVELTGDVVDWGWTFTSRGVADWTPVLLGPEGQLEWWADLSLARPSLAELGLEGAAITRVRPREDGRGVWLLAFPVLSSGGDGSGLPLDTGRVFAVDWDGVVEVVDLPSLHHDFLLRDGDLVALAWDPRDSDGGPLVGDTLVGPGAPSDWSSFDSFDLPLEPGSTADGVAYWSLCNALAHDPATDRLAVGCKDLSSIALIDGDELTTLGGLTLLGGSLPVHQHGIDFTDEGLLVFDNGPDGAPSRVVEYAIDLAAGTIDERWSVTADPPRHGAVLGDARRLDDGHTRIAWAAEGAIADVDADGTERGRVDLGAGVFVGYLQIVADDPFGR